MSNARMIWDKLLGAGLTPAGAAELMGNLQAESGLNPRNLQNSCEKKLGMSDEDYTAAVDCGAYTGFVSDGAGYGLAQWTYASRKAALLAYAKARGRSVGDLDTQVGYLLQELQSLFPAVWDKLCSTASVREASDCVLLKFERPANQSEANRARRTALGQGFYDQFAEKGESIMTPQERLIATAEDQMGYFGKKTNANLDEFKANPGGRFNKFARDLDALGDFYNGKKNGYDWCDVFVDWCFVETFGRATAQLLLCQPNRSLGAGTGYSLNYYKQKGRFFTGTPQPADQIFFGDSKSTWHTGLVVKVEGGYVHTIEGNAGNPSAVRACRYAVGGKTIKGYGRPDWSLVPEEKEDNEMDYEKWKEYMDRYRQELRADHDQCWAEEELAAAVAAGITDGKRPHDLVTREEAAIMAVRSRLGKLD